MFGAMIILSAVIGFAIAGIGLFGNNDHDKGRGRNDR